MVWYRKGHYVGEVFRMILHLLQCVTNKAFVSTWTRTTYSNNNISFSIPHARTRSFGPGHSWHVSWWYPSTLLIEICWLFSPAAFSTYERKQSRQSLAPSNRRIPTDLSHLKALERPEGPIPQDVAILDPCSAQPDQRITMHSLF